MDNDSIIDSDEEATGGPALLGRLDSSEFASRPVRVDVSNGAFESQNAEVASVCSDPPEVSNRSGEAAECVRTNSTLNAAQQQVDFGQWVDFGTLVKQLEHECIVGDTVKVVEGDVEFSGPPVDVSVVRLDVKQSLHAYDAQRVIAFLLSATLGSPLKFATPPYDLIKPIESFNRIFRRIIKNPRNNITLYASLLKVAFGHYAGHAKADYMTADEFMAMLSEYCGMHALHHEIFDAMDRSRLGRIRSENFVAGILASMPDASHKFASAMFKLRLQHIFRLYDLDRKGHVDQRGLQLLFEHANAALAAQEPEQHQTQPRVLVDAALDKIKVAYGQVLTYESFYQCVQQHLIPNTRVLFRLPINLPRAIIERLQTAMEQVLQQLKQEREQLKQQKASTSPSRSPLWTSTPSPKIQPLASMQLQGVSGTGAAGAKGMEKHMDHYQFKGFDKMWTPLASIAKAGGGAQGPGGGSGFTPLEQPAVQVVGEGIGEEEEEKKKVLGGTPPQPPASLEESFDSFGVGGSGSGTGVVAAAAGGNVSSSGGISSGGSNVAGAGGFKLPEFNLDKDLDGLGAIKGSKFTSIKSSANAELEGKAGAGTVPSFKASAFKPPVHGVQVLPAPAAKFYSSVGAINAQPAQGKDDLFTFRGSTPRAADSGTGTGTVLGAGVAASIGTGVDGQLDRRVPINVLNYHGSETCMELEPHQGYVKPPIKTQWKIKDFKGYDVLNFDLYNQSTAAASAWSHHTTEHASGGLGGWKGNSQGGGAALNFAGAKVGGGSEDSNVAVGVGGGVAVGVGVGSGSAGAGEKVPASGTAVTSLNSGAAATSTTATEDSKATSTRVVTKAAARENRKTGSGRRTSIDSITSQPGAATNATTAAAIPTPLPLSLLDHTISLPPLTGRSDASSVIDDALETSLEGRLLRLRQRYKMRYLGMGTRLYSDDSVALDILVRFYRRAFKNVNFAKYLETFDWCTLNELYRLCDLVTTFCAQEQPVISIKGPCQFFGALNGDVLGLVDFFNTFGWPLHLESNEATPRNANTTQMTNMQAQGKAYKVCFLGGLHSKDGKFNLETLMLVFALKAVFPMHIHLLQGGEALAPDYSDSLYQQIHKVLVNNAKQMNLLAPDDEAFITTSAHDLYNRIKDAIAHMSVACILDNQVIGVHATIDASFKSPSQLYFKKPLTRRINRHVDAAIGATRRPHPQGLTNVLAQAQLALLVSSAALGTTPTGAIDLKPYTSSRVGQLVQELGQVSAHQVFYKKRVHVDTIEKVIQVASNGSHVAAARVQAIDYGHIYACVQTLYKNV